MNIVAILLVALGASLLTVALAPTKTICREGGDRTRWRVLGALILFFIVGYLVFGAYLIIHPAAVIDCIAAAILASGGLFVYAVVRSTLGSILHIKTMVERERHRSLHDELTELPNRTLLQDRIDYAILLARRQREPFAILLLDLNNFKEINDAFGHFYGDYLLQQVAVRLKKVVRATDTLARLGGDEFAMVLPGANLEQAVAISHKLTAALEEPFVVEGHELTVGVSTGIAVYPEHGEEGELLLQHADVAMYVAKRNEVVYAVYDREEDTTSMNRLIMIGQLRGAITARQLVLHYQPKISLRDGHLCGVEALVRWQHPEQGNIPPDNFIPLAEQAGLMQPLTAWVLQQALEQNAAWRRRGCRLPIAVNLSVKNLHDYGLPDLVAEQLKKWQVPPGDLTLEITETSMMTDPSRVKKVIERLARLGVRMAIDDFGTGYSSLAYLRKFPAMEIKIDKSFIMDMLKNEDNRVIVRSTIDMVHTIGRQVVAEGVEDEATLDLLEELGCDCLQGYHIARPMAVSRFNEWLDSAHWQVLRAEER